MDIWSDKNRQSYLAITAHWIANVEGTTALQLKASLIAFHRLLGGHDGVSLATTVLALLDQAGVTLKVIFYNIYQFGTDFLHRLGILPSTMPATTLQC